VVGACWHIAAEERFCVAEEEVVAVENLIVEEDVRQLEISLALYASFLARERKVKHLH